MKEPTDKQIAAAGLVLKAVKQIDPYFVNADTAMAKGWAMIFMRRSYTLEEMLEGVIDFYTHETNGRHCMPGNVLEGAKRARARREATDPEYKARVEARREARQDAWDAKLSQQPKPAIVPPEQRVTPSEWPQIVHKITEGKKL